LQHRSGGSEGGESCGCALDIAFGRVDQEIEILRGTRPIMKPEGVPAQHHVTHGGALELREEIDEVGRKAG
jgi:hypothetical protein